MVEELALAVRLQTLDSKAASLELEVTTLPKQLAEIEKRLETHKRRLEADRAALVANQRDRKKLEGDIQSHEQKISKLRDQMLQAKTNEQYRAFQSEIGWAETEIRKSEDKILDLMEQSEALERTVKADEASLKQQADRVDKEKDRVRERIAAGQAQLAELRAERKGVVGRMDAKFYADYERIHRKTHGSVVADATDGHCSACMITLRPQFVQDLRRGDKIMHCESCSRMLTYNPPVSFENNVGPAATTA
jgi:predicted  nucleic acid-binding Zn-ribbon protein